MLATRRWPVRLWEASRSATPTGKPRRQQDQAAAQQTAAGQGAYTKARGACLEGKGYTVK